MTADPFDTVRAGIRIHPDEPTDVMVALEANALSALASIEERLKEAERLLEVERRSRVVGRILAEKAEAERDALQHIIDCADTPLMRDVLRERDVLEAALREIAKLPRSGYTRVEYAGDIGMREKTPKAIARRALCETEKATLCETKSQAGAGLGASPNAQPEP